jgi:hypothetical protein
MNREISFKTLPRKMKIDSVYNETEEFKMKVFLNAVFICLTRKKEKKSGDFACCLNMTIIALLLIVKTKKHHNIG